MYTDGADGSRTNKLMMLHMSFLHDDDATKGTTAYNLQGLGIPVRDSRTHSFDPYFEAAGKRGGRRVSGRLFRRQLLSDIIGFRGLTTLFSRECTRILLHECYAWRVVDPAVPGMKAASDYITGKELCPTVMTWILEKLQMPHDFMRIGEVCYCMVYIEPEMAKQLLNSMHINARRRWVMSEKANQDPTHRETSTNAKHAPQFVHCSSVQINKVSIFDRNGKPHYFKECSEVMRLIAYMVQTLTPQKRDRNESMMEGDRYGLWNLVTPDVTAMRAQMGLFPPSLTPRGISNMAMLRPLDTMSDEPMFLRPRHYAKFLR